MQSNIFSPRASEKITGDRMARAVFYMLFFKITCFFLAKQRIGTGELHLTRVVEWVSITQGNGQK